MTILAMREVHHQPPSSSSSSSSSSGSDTGSAAGTGGGGLGGLFSFKFEQNENGSFVVSVFQQEGRRSVHQQDDVGALYYVVAVILIYGCSILMMIASYIRKNKVDRRLNRYLKEMANVRKRERRMTLMSSAAKAKRPPATDGSREGGAGGGVHGSAGRDPERSQSPSPSFNLTPSGRESPALLQTGENSPVADTGVLDGQPPGGSRHHSPFLGVDRLGWPGLHGGPRRPNSPVLIVCDHSDYDSDSEPNNSDRSDYHRPPRHSGRKSVKLCVPIDLVAPTDEQGRRVPTVACPGQARAARDFGARQQQDSVNSSDCRSDDESSSCLKPLWDGTQAVSNV